VSVFAIFFLVGCTTSVPELPVMQWYFLNPIDGTLRGFEENEDRTVESLCVSENSEGVAEIPDGKAACFVIDHRSYFKLKEFAEECQQKKSFLPTQ